MCYTLKDFHPNRSMECGRRSQLQQLKRVQALVGLEKEKLGESLAIVVFWWPKMSQL
jgi:hypothetical protein